jgi:hypothetical protein
VLLSNLLSTTPLLVGSVPPARNLPKARYPGAIKVIREKRFAIMVMTKYGPQPFTAKPDLIVVQDILDKHPADADEVHVKIVDYKSIAGIGHDMTEAKFEHQLQVNIYAWVVSQCLPNFLELPGAEVVVDSVEIVYCSMRKIRRFTSGSPRVTKGKRKPLKPLTYEPLTLQPIKLWTMPQMGRYSHGGLRPTWMHARSRFHPCSKAMTPDSATTVQSSTCAGKLETDG